jgi:hypothetical protein
MKGCVALVVLLSAVGLTLEAHDFGSAQITWNREVSRIVYERCASCHREGGTSFSLMTYREAQPYADAIKDSVLARRMPPWGAVKGFGAFRNDDGLTQEQVELITDWVVGGMLKGNNPKVLPKPPKFETPEEYRQQPGAVTVSGTTTLRAPLRLDGLLPERAPDGTQIVAELPDGNVRPLLWLYEYRDEYRHPFLLRTPLDLPAGTIIRGVRPTAKVVLLPASSHRDR